MIIGIDASRATTGQRTGTEAYAYFLIRALIPLAGERGHRLRLYFNTPPFNDLFPDAAWVDQVVISQRRLWTHARLGHELRRRPPDVFFTPAHVIPVGVRCPSVATVHDLGYEYFPEAHPRQQLAYLRWSTRHNARAARRVIADSHATRDDLARLYVIEPAKTEVIYPGIDPDMRPVEDADQVAATLARYAIQPPYLLYLGTLQPRKNLVRLVEAFAKSNLFTQGYTLVLAGKAGWLSHPLFEAVAGAPAGVRERLLLPGFISDEDKATVLSGATALVFPSLYEGFGFPVLEAQACDTPVVCSDSSSLPEVAGEGALLVDPKDTAAIAAALRQVVEDGALQGRLVTRGRANLARFDWRITARRVLNLLEQVKGRGAPPLQSAG